MAEPTKEEKICDIEERQKREKLLISKLYQISQIATLLASTINKYGLDNNLKPCCINNSKAIKMLAQEIIDMCGDDAIKELRLGDEE